MNIFMLHTKPTIAAQSMVDKHVVKMILETAQLLCTAHRVIDGEMYIDKTASGRKIKRWKHPDSYMEENLYKATHINHPSAVWCREHIGNYIWLYDHFKALLEEYTFRYDKEHKCESMLDMLSEAPVNIDRLFPKLWLVECDGRKEVIVGTEIQPAMDYKYIVPNNPIESYRRYYREGKTHLHSWKRRKQPEWMITKDAQIQTVYLE
jgi:hypothetical protein